MTLLSSSQIREVIAILAAANPEPKTELVSVNDFTLLVAVMLSAQMTDKGVNKATGELFRVADTPAKMLALGEARLGEYVKSVNLWPTKTRHIIAACRALEERFGGKVPGTREELESLPGVGRKTANVILNVVYGQPVMPVDTHLLRVAPRLGLSAATTPRAVEEDLLAKIPQDFLANAHHWLLLHGRYVCVARSPKCSECPVERLCPKNGLEC